VQYATALLEYLDLTALLEHPRKEMILSKGGFHPLNPPVSAPVMITGGAIG